MWSRTSFVLAVLVCCVLADDAVLFDSAIRFETHPGANGFQTMSTPSHVLSVYPEVNAEHPQGFGNKVTINVGRFMINNNILIDGKNISGRFDPPAEAVGLFVRSSTGYHTFAYPVGPFDSLSVYSICAGPDLKQNKMYIYIVGDTSRDAIFGGVYVPTKLGASMFVWKLNMDLTTAAIQAGTIRSTMTSCVVLPHTDPADSNRALVVGGFFRWNTTWDKVTFFAPDRMGFMISAPLTPDEMTYTTYTCNSEENPVALSMTAVADDTMRGMTAITYSANLNTSFGSAPGVYGRWSFAAVRFKVDSSGIHFTDMVPVPAVSGTTWQGNLLSPRILPVNKDSAVISWGFKGFASIGIGNCTNPLGVMMGRYDFGAKLWRWVQCLSAFVLETPEQSQAVAATAFMAPYSSTQFIVASSFHGDKSQLCGTNLYSRGSDDIFIMLASLATGKCSALTTWGDNITNHPMGLAYVNDNAVVISVASFTSWDSSSLTLLTFMPVPCVNGVVSAKLKTCVCLPGYLGPKCDLTCGDATPCGGNGTCLLKGNATVCHCNPGRVGKACEHACPGTTNGAACSGNGLCVETQAGAECKCVCGFTGKSCESAGGDDSGQKDDGDALSVSWLLTVALALVFA